MKVILTMIRLGIRRRSLGPTVVAVVVVALAAAGISSAVIVRRDAANAVDAAFADHGGPDLVVNTGSDAIEEVSAALAADPRVREVTSPRRVVDVQAEIDGDRIPFALAGMAEGGETTALNQPVLTSGRWPTRSSEVAIDASVARETGLAPGDTVPVRGVESGRTFTVVGLAYDLTDCFYPACDPARAWTVEPALAGLDPDPGALVAVRLVDPELAEVVGQDLVQARGAAEVSFDTWPDTRADLLTESDFFGAFLAAFGLLALVASSVVITGIITMRTWSRRRDLAQLRSLGCTRSRLTVALLVEHLLIGLTGCLVGIALAALIAPSLRVGALGVLDGPASGVPLSVAVVTTAIVLTICLLATAAPAIRAGRRDAVVGLGAAPEVSARGSALGRVLQRVPLPIWGDLGARTSLSRPLRTALAAAAIALTLVTAVTALSITQTMDDMLERPGLAGDPADATVVPPRSMSVERVGRLVQHEPEIASWFTVADTSAVVGDRTLHVRGIGEGSGSTGFVIGDGAPVVRAGQAVAGYGLLAATGLQIGQTIRLDHQGRTTEVKLVGWYRETEDSGEVLQVQMDDLRRIDPTASRRVAVVGADGTTPAEVGAALSRAFGDATTVEIHDSDARHLAPFRFALAAMAAMVGGVALANLISTLVVASRERFRRTGTLRALGMSRRSTVAEALAAAALPLVAAVLIGIPLGGLVSRGLGDALTSQLGAGPGLSHTPPAAQLAVLVAGVAGIAFAVPVIAARPAVARQVPDLLQEPA